MTKPPKTDAPPINLSEAFKELESITSEFESGQVGLEAGLPKFRRGLELAKQLKARLSEIENEIIQIKADFSDNDSA